MILILSRDNDIHAQRVHALLEKEGRESAVFNPALFPLDATATARAGPNGPTANIEWADSKLDLQEVSAVWLRRPDPPAPPADLSAGENKWLDEESAKFFDSLWAHTTEALWVSEPQNIRHANLKLRQLRLAHGLGFSVPPYIVTNRPAEARAFIDAHHDGVIVKAVHRPALMSDEKAAAVYTHLLEPGDLDLLDTVRFGPTYLQAFVRKSRDIRITVIGDQVFPVAIDSLAIEGAETDFRKAEVFDMPHESVDLPAKLHDACRQLVTDLGLNFGAIDLLETPEGDYHFLEINPNGQWMWIEWMTELPLSQTMCDFLASRQR